MKKLSTLCMVATLLLGAWSSCTDEKKEIIGIDVVEAYDISFEIKDQKITSTSYTFEVTPSDLENPYVCLYVDKSVIDRVPKQELPTFLLTELKKNAQAESKIWSEYLSSITVKGKATKTISNLLPGNMYELVVFGIKGEQLSQSAGYRFFETLKADQIKMDFAVTVDNSSHEKVHLDVTPSMDDKLWYLCSFTKDQYDKIKVLGMSDQQIAQSYLNEEFRQSLPPNKEPSKEQLDAFISQKFHTGAKRMTVGGRALKADTEYVYLITAVFVSPSYEVVFISETTFGVFRTANVPQKQTTFELKVDNITQTTASISITPSDLTQKYVWRCDVYNETTMKMTPEEHAKHVIATNPYIFFEAFAHQIINYPARKLVPGTKHYLMAFGYEGGICTKVFRQDIDPQPAGDPMATDFTVNILKNTSDRVELQVTPTDNTVYYVPLLYPDTRDKESVKGRLIADFRRNLERTRESGFNPYADLWSVIDQQATLGEGSFSWSSLEPGKSHTLLILTFKKDGIASDKYFKPGYIQIPGLSQDKVGDVVVAGIFDGDEENGSVFNQKDAVKGKVIIALKYNKVDAAITEAYASVNIDDPKIKEEDPSVISDAELMRSNIRWSLMNRNAPFQFVLTDWQTPQMSYSYGINAKGERGPIARTPIPGAEKEKKSPIADLQKLVDEANGKKPTTTSILRSLTNMTVLQTEGVESYMPQRILPQSATSAVAPKSQFRALQLPTKHQAEVHIPIMRAVK